MKRLVVGALVTSALLVVPVGPAPAETTVDPNGSSVTVTMTVDVVGAEGETSPDGTMSLIDYWETILNDTWGAAFKQMPYKGCYFFKLKVKLKAQPKRFDQTKGRHRIIVSAPTGGLTFDGAGFNGTDNETSRNPTTGDGTRFLENDAGGAIPIDAPPTVVAHEFGHLFGLGDDRENGMAKTTREGTMMVGGVPGVDVNVVQKIDRKLIERIGKIIERYLRDKKRDPLAKCQSWNGTVRSTWNGSLCTGSEEGTITVGVVGNEASGTVAQSGTYACPGIASAAGMQVGELSGTFKDDEFRFLVEPFIVTYGENLTSGCLAVPERPIPVPVTERTIAKASFEWNLGTEQYTCEITLERQTDDEPVG